MYFECATAPVDHITFSVTAGSPEAARHAFSVCSQVAFAGSPPIGSSAAPTGAATARTSAATAAATTHRHVRPAQELTVRTLPGAFRGHQGPARASDGVADDREGDDRGDHEPVPAEDREVVALEVADHPLDRDRGPEERGD